MNKKRLMEEYFEYKKAVNWLGEALQEDVSNPLLYDGVIQRFEFAYELAWKLIRRYLELEGLTEVNSPRAAFREAFAMGIIGDGHTWIDMLNARNLTVHTYNELLAKDIYTRIRDKYYPLLVDFVVLMGGRM